MKKRILLPVLLIALLLSAGCSSKPDGENGQPDVDETPQIVTNNMGETVTDYVPKIADPLTGLSSDADYSLSRPIAVMVNNYHKAMPQIGIQDAGIIYEMLAEGGITRMLAVYSSAESIPKIGTLRSARHYYADIANGLGAVYIHFGGSPQAYSYIQQHKLDAVDGLNYDGTYFFRDAARRKASGSEHSAWSDGENIAKAIVKLSFSTEKDENDPYPFAFMPEELQEAEVPVTEVKINFSQYNSKSRFVYNAETRLYEKYQYGKEHVDENTGKALRVKNVFILEMPSALIKNDSAGRLDIKTVSSGKGIYVSNGCQYDITWSKAAADKPFTFTLDETGNPLAINRGNSYINCVDKLENATFITE